MPASIDLSALDALFSDAYAADLPGAAVLVAQEGRPLLRKAYGMANLELGVPLRPEMVFRIGSVTKQFTAAAILMLLEEGKLALDDPLEKFLPGYPVHGHTITVEHLLTHTSGIQSYTGMPDFEKVMTRDMTPTEMVDFFKGQPMEFAPAKRYNYNNSGYFLLGVIIEKLAGVSYAEFLQQRIFDPLEMKNTYYDDPKRIIPNRASGYAKDNETLINDRYLSMTQPFSAGALASTVDDLLAWDSALYTEKLVSRESLQRAWTPYRLADGKELHYGYGWGLHTYQGSTWIEHGGGINGFLCQAIRLPQEKLYVAVLTNTTAPKTGPSEVANRAAAIALGQPIQLPAPVELAADKLTELEGDYLQSPNDAFKAVAEDGKLKLVHENWPDLPLTPVGVDHFISQRLGLSQLHFHRAEDGAVTKFELVNIFGEVDLEALKK